MCYISLATPIVSPLILQDNRRFLARVVYIVQVLSNTLPLIHEWELRHVQFILWTNSFGLFFSINTYNINLSVVMNTFHFEILPVSQILKSYS